VWPFGSPGHPAALVDPYAVSAADLAEAILTRPSSVANVEIPVNDLSFCRAIAWPRPATPATEARGLKGRTMFVAADAEEGGLVRSGQLSRLLHFAETPWLPPV
jgi:hypothetical protein